MAFSGSLEGKPMARQRWNEIGRILRRYQDEDMTPESLQSVVSQLVIILQRRKRSVDNEDARSELEDIAGELMDIGKDDVDDLNLVLESLYEWAEENEIGLGT
jgi:hypothetical protein